MSKRKETERHIPSGAQAVLTWHSSGWCKWPWQAVTVQRDLIINWENDHFSRTLKNICQNT